MPLDSILLRRRIGRSIHIVLNMRIECRNRRKSDSFRRRCSRMKHKCTICWRIRSEAEFYVHPRTHYRKRQCRECEARKKRAAYRANPKKHIRAVRRSEKFRERRFFYPNNNDRILTADIAQCRQCGFIGHHRHFYLDKGYPRSKCKKCEKEYHKELYMRKTAQDRPRCEVSHRHEVSLPQR